MGELFLACLGAAATVGGAILAALVVMHMQNRNDRKKIERRLDFLLDEYPLHRHGEKNGPLTVLGITYPAGTNGQRRTS